MMEDQGTHHGPSNLSNRLPEYNYRNPGWYYVTICADRHIWQFGMVIDDQMHLNDAGAIVQTAWESLPRRFPGVTLDEYVIMPNHVHGILILPETYPPEAWIGKKKWHRPSVGNILRTFKGAATYQIRHTTAKHTFQWQPNYHDHITRNDPDLDHLRQYIINNPEKWAEDKYYSKSVIPPKM